MGLVSSKPGEDVSQAAFEQWAAYRSQLCGGPATVGAGHKKQGLERVRAMTGPSDSAQRHAFVRKVAELFAREMNLKAIDSTAAIDKVIESMRAEVPDPRRSGNGKIWSDSPKSQMKAVGALSRAINSASAKVGVGEPIDTKAPVTNQVDKAMEVIGGTMQGIVAEFQMVHEPVKKAVKNLRKLLAFLDQNYNLLEQKMQSSDQAGETSSLTSETALIRSVHKEITDEVKTHLGILEQMVTGTIDKFDERVALLSKDNDEFKRLVAKIKGHVPDAKIGEKISYALSGLRGLAEATAIVDKALGQLGMSKGEYEHLKTSQDLDRKLDSIIASKLHESEGSLREYIKAVDTIRKNQWQHGDLVKAMKGKKGGAVDNSPMPTIVHEGGKKLDKRVTARRMVRDRLLRVFVSEMSVGLNRFLRAVEGVAALTKGGNGLEITDAIEKFTRAFATLDIAKKYIYYALSGYDPSVNSRQEREKFIGNAKYLMGVIEDIIKEGPKFNEHATPKQKEVAKAAFSNFRGMADGMGAMLKTVNQFSDKFGEGFRNLLPAMSKADDKKKGASEDSSAVLETGAVDEEAAVEGTYVGSADIPELTRLSVDFDKVRNDLIYGVRLSKIRLNLAKSAEERSHYAQDYMKIMPDAIAAAVDKQTEAYSALMARLKEPDTFAAAVNYDPLILELFRDTASGNKITDVKALTAARLKLAALLDFAKKQHDARVTMYRTAEAVDLYLKRFSDGIAKEPDSISNVVRAMEVTHMNANWFTETSGDAVAYVFEAFPSWFQGKIAGESNLADPSNRSKEHYYERVAKAMGTGGMAGLTLKKTPSGPIGLPGNPLLSITVDKVAAVLKLTEQAYAVGALKNIFSTFAVIGDKFAGQKLEDQSHMTAHEIYKKLVEYMVASSFALGVSKTRGGGPAATGFVTFTADDLRLEPITAPRGAGAGNSVIDGANYAAGVSGTTLVGDADMHWKTQSAVTLRSVNSSLAARLYDDPFVETDQLFVMCVKGVVAKVLTAIGVYNMFNRGINQHGLGYSSGLRLVLGGAVGTPKIIPEALELYARLPLMAEFYRAIFNFEQLDDGFRSISLVPEMDGTFSGLIALIFDKARYVKDGGYSDTDIRLIIEEVNKIYLQFKNKSNPVNECFQEFIAEVNRRYGWYKREERIKYLEDRDQRYKEKFVSSEDLDVDVELPGLDEHSVPRPAPSMSFQTKGINNSTWRDHKHALDLKTHQQMVTQLRETVDKIFKHGMDQLTLRNNDMQEPANSLTEIKYGHISFEPMLRARREELKYAKTDKERYDIIQSTINSLGSFSLNALSKNLVMFHEAVVAPLNGLMALFVMLRKFKSDIDSLHGVVAILKGFETTVKDAAGFNAPALLAELHRALFGVGPVPPASPLYQLVPQLGTGIVLKPGRQGYPSLEGGAATADVAFDTVVRAAATLSVGDGVQLLQRFCVKQDALYARLFENLYAHGSSLEKLVEMRLEVARNPNGTCAISLHLDHSKLHQHIADTFNAVKMSVDRFRGLVPDAMIKEYEMYESGKSGSLYYLEKEFIDTFLHGRYYDSDKKDNLGAQTERGFDSIVTKVNDVLRHLTRKWDVSGRGFRPTGTAADFKNCDGLRADGSIGGEKDAAVHADFAEELYRQIFYSAAAVAGPGTAGPPIVYPGRGLEKLLFNTTGKEKAGKADKAPWGPTNTVDALYSPTKGFHNDNTLRGVVVSFNRLVAAYLNEVYDDPSRRVYLTTLNTFATGAFSKAILGDETYDDSSIVATNIFSKVPANTSAAKGVLFKSLAQAIKQLIMEPNHKGDKKEFAEPDLAEIALYVKERLRGSLPIFAKRFHLLIYRCELLKRMVQALNSVQHRDLAAGMPKRARLESEQNLTYALDEVINGSNALLQCIGDTLKDLADDPRYLQTHSSSIQEYESLNGKQPFMPLSSVMYYMSNCPVGAADEERASALQPNAMMGENRFKLQFGTRGLLQQAIVKLDEMPGLAEIMREHNQSCDDRHHFADKELIALVNGHLSLVRYMSDAKNHVQDLCAFLVDGAGVAPSADIQLSHAAVDLAGVDSDMLALEGRGVVYQLDRRVNLAEVIALTESNNKVDQIRKIVAHLEDSANSCKILGDRTAHLAYNFIDLNMVPINVHALMREMACINLINYSYTYDKLMQEVFNLPEPNYNMSSVDPMGTPGVESAERSRPVPGNSVTNPRSAKHLMGAMLLDPYMDVSYGQYMTLFAQTMRGDLGIDGLGQPKYLAQEIYNKALFGEIYPGADAHHEPDAATGDAGGRGARRVVELTQVDVDKVKIPTKELIYAILRQCVVEGGSGSALVLLAGYGEVMTTKAKLASIANEADSIVAGLENASDDATALNRINLALAAALRPGSALRNGTLDLGNQAVAADASHNAALIDEVVSHLAVAIAMVLHLAGTQSRVRSKLVLARKNPGGSSGGILVEQLNDAAMSIYNDMKAPFNWSFGSPLGLALADARDSATAGKVLPTAWLSGAYKLPAGVSLAGSNLYGQVTSAIAKALSEPIARQNVPPSVDPVPTGTRSANPRFYPSYGSDLHYLAHNKSESDLKSVAVGTLKPYLFALGKLRFDTVLARNQIFVTNIQRALRLKLRREMVWYNEKVVSSYSIAASSMTELFDHQMHKDRTSLLQY
jgi:hypothetical protein